MSLPLNLVYLQPESIGPVDYIRSIEKAGLVALPQKYLAMYTMSGTPSIGPQGPPGIDQNSWFDTIIDAATDEESPIIADPIKRKSTFRNPYPMDLTLGYVRASLGTAPVGADFIVDIHMNGVSMFDTPIHIDDGSETSVGSVTPAVIRAGALYVPDDAKYEVFVLQTGSIVAGAGLKVAITGIKTEEQ